MSVGEVIAVHIEEEEEKEGEKEGEREVEEEKEGENSGRIAETDSSIVGMYCVYWRKRY